MIARDVVTFYLLINLWDILIQDNLKNNAKEIFLPVIGITRRKHSL